MTSNEGNQNHMKLEQNSALKRWLLAMSRNIKR